MTEKLMKGTPPIAFLPAKNYIFKITEEYYVIELPRHGSYIDLDPEFFTEEDGSFDILGENGILYTPSLTKVLFATKQYPNLKFNQFFVPVTIKFNEDKVILVGQIVDMMLQAPTSPEGESKEE